MLKSFSEKFILNINKLLINKKILTFDKNR